jgi:hypothetical protein
MILPDFVLPSRVNQTWSYSGIDSLELCLNKKHFESYPHDITYRYNSRGFRDAEWPNNIEELQSAIWCVGDSFTVGLGSPLEHTWPWILQQITQRRTINVSMDGASNMWIARKSLDIVNKIKPAHLVIQWSYISRREKNINDILDESWQLFYKSIADPSWPICSIQDIDKLPPQILEEVNRVYGGFKMDIVDDEARRSNLIKCSVDDDIKNTLDCINLVNQHGSTQLVHSFIPNFVPKTHQGIVESQIAGMVIPEIQRVDLARDGHHYDIATSQRFVQQIVQYLS